MATDPSILLSRGACYKCIPNGLQESVLVSLAVQWGNLSPGDPDANAYIAAAGLTDATQKAAIQKFVTDLKGNGTPSYWSREVIIYPFLGGAGATPYASTRVNLRSPGSYDWIRTVGHEPLYSAVGLKGVTTVGSEAYLRTGYIFAPVQQDFVRIFHYLDTEATVDFSMYAGAIGGGPFTLLRHDNAANQLTFWFNDGTPTADFAGAGLLGGFCFQRNGVNTKQVARRGLGFDTFAPGSTGVPNVELYIFAYNNGGVPTSPGNALLSGWSLGQPFSSDADWAGYYSIWQTFQTTLGRQH